MPMVLRSRKSIRLSEASEVDSLDTTETESRDTTETESRDTTETESLDTSPPVTPRRSARPPGRAAYEESDESDPESVQGRLMETHRSPPAELEEEAAEEAPVMELKYCSVVLDRLQVDNKAARKEPEDKEDMNRKGGKPVSRIPTFHKRPTSASQTTELPAPKKDAAVHGAQPPEKAGSGSTEASKSKSLDTSDTALPLPSARIPKMGYEAPSLFSGTEQACGPQITAPKSCPESVPYSPMTVTPRPALRPDDGSEQHVPERDQSKTFDIEVDAIQDTPASHLPDEGYICQKPPPEEKYDVEIKSRITLTASGDTGKPADVLLHATEVNQEEAIMDEQPPWGAEPLNTLESKDSSSSSDTECEDKFADDKSEGCDSAEEEEEQQQHHEPLISKMEFSDLAQERANVDESISPVEPEKPTKAQSTKQAKSSGCSSFTLFCFLPTTLLLLGGFGQHVWHYGLPMSVAQLTAQLELHMLEGFSLVPEPCSTDCRVHLVESIPEGLYRSSPMSRRSIADSWLHLLDRANSSVHIAAFYFTLRGDDLADSSDSQGRRVFEQLKHLGSKGVKLQLAVNAPQTSTKDMEELAAAGAEVREVDLKAVTGGIVHTKLWVVDQKHFYLGSANMDWRSLSQVKEVGLSVEDCSCLAQDAFRIFGVYWSVGGANNASLPLYWPARLSALSSSQNPLRLKLNGVSAQVYLSSAPPQISTRGRSDDLAAILSVINDAQKFIHISVMDYLPLSQFTEPLRFWPAIDSALRAAACTRGVQVRLLVSCWKHSPASMFTFLQSLLVLNRPQLKCDIDVRIFTVPSTAEQIKIPFARVNHAKYMVTDRVVYIGTSNWSENYFTQTAGVGLVVNQTGSVVEKGQETLQSQAEELFLRDWTSEYASTLSVDDEDVCPRGPL